LIYFLKVILSKKTTTSTITQNDPSAEPKHIMSRMKLLGLPINNKNNRKEIVEFDKTIITVDSIKFFTEFTQALKNIEGKFYKCQLQQMDDHYYYINCFYNDNDDDNVDVKSQDNCSLSSSSSSYLSDSNDDESLNLGKKNLNPLKITFKILIRLKLETVKTNLTEKTDSSSTTSATLTKNGNEKASSPVSSVIKSNSNEKSSTVDTSTTTATSTTTPLPNKFNRFQHQAPTYSQAVTGSNQSPIEKTEEINQLQIKVYFNFNFSILQKHQYLIEKLSNEFNNQINDTIQLVYLRLLLKDIHYSNKWNNLLQLKDTLIHTNSLNYSNSLSTLTKSKISSDVISSGIATTEVLEKTLLSTQSDNNQEKNDSSLIKDTLSDTLSDKSENKKQISNEIYTRFLTCDSVWSVNFKLHRYHQTLQKIHTKKSTLSTNSLSMSQQQQQQQQQQSIPQASYISHGLKKLQECKYLANFKIEDSDCGDLYVYTHQTEIFILKLEEIYETTTRNSTTPHHNSNTNISSSQQQNQQITNNDTSTSMNLQGSTGRTPSTSLLSRRPSYASMNEHDLNGKKFNSINKKFDFKNKTLTLTLANFSIKKKFISKK
jgi:hypothetical protein